MKFLTQILLITLLCAACHDTPRKNPFDPVLTPAVELVEVRLDADTGDAYLVWTVYVGEQPTYLILRQVQGP